MKKFCIIVIAVLLGSEVYSATVNFSTKQEAVNQNNKTKIRCSLCNGTGFSANSKGEKGKGKYTCVRCKGTGKI